MRRTIALAARIGSVFTVGLLLVVVGSRFGTDDTIAAATPREWLMLACFPGLVAGGQIVGWWRPFRGGMITVVGLAAFYVIHAVFSDAIATGPYFALFALPGLFFLLEGLLGWKDHRGARPGRVITAEA